MLRGLCRERIALKNVSLTAIITLSLRPLISSQFSEKLLTMYILQILPVPGLIHHMEQITPEVYKIFNIYDYNEQLIHIFPFQCLAAFKSHLIFDKCIEFLSADQNLRMVFNTLEGNQALCLLANLVQLASSDDRSNCEIYFPSFVVNIKMMYLYYFYFIVC